MIRGIIFDLGNTLMYFDGEWETTIAHGVENMRVYLNQRGFTLPATFDTDFRKMRDKGLQQRLQSNSEYTAEQALNDTLAWHSICWIPEAIYPHAIRKFFDAEQAHWRAYDDARATLENLRARGFKLALMSNATDHAFIERIARNGNIAEFFEPLLSSAKISHRKPDPRAFQPILDAWQIPPNEIVMVGDSPAFDILGARRAGMRGVLIKDRWETAPKPHGELADADLMQPDAVISQLTELPAVIDAMNGEE
jgi:2-haloalkanoic acid dehalogenase type II